MALYIKDDEVDALAEQLQAAVGARTKPEAVRTALLHELERIKAGQSFAERNAEAFALADRIGAPNADLNMKVLMDRLWDE
jgi:antitoxin VapB